MKRGGIISEFLLNTPEYLQGLKFSATMLKAKNQSKKIGVSSTKHWGSVQSIRRALAILLDQELGHT